MRGMTRSIFRWSAATAVAGQAARRADRGGARRRRGSARRIWSAMPRKISPSAGRRTRRRRSGRCAACARYRLGGLARRRGQPGHRAGAAVLSARARRQAVTEPAARCRRSPPHHDGVACRLVARRHPVVEPAARATRRGSPNCMAPRFTAAGAKANSSDMLSERNTLVHRLRLGRKIIGFVVSRMAADEAEILSIAVDAEPSRPRPVAQPAADASRPSRRPRRAHRVPRGRGKQSAGAAALRTGRISTSSAAANAITGRPAGNN